MKLLIQNSASVNCFVNTLPLAKGLSDLFPNYEIHYEAPLHFSAFKEHIPYIHRFVTESEVNSSSYKIIINLENGFVKGSELLSENMEKHKNSMGMHIIDKYLSILPPSFRKRQFLIKESLTGFEKISELKKNMQDLVIYPLTNSDESWSLNSYDQFIRYMLQMDPAIKILIVGLEPHGEKLNSFFSQKDYYNKNIGVQIFDLETLISFLKRVSAIVIPSCPVKNLICNPETIVIEFCESDETSPIYKENAHFIQFEKKKIHKLIYSSEEMAFDSKEHFLAYYVTSVLEEDVEKLSWLSNAYTDEAKIYSTAICKNLGFYLKPSVWNREKILEYVTAVSMLSRELSNKNTSIAENFYHSMHDETELSQDYIMYELSVIQKEVKKLKNFFDKENSFSHYMKLKNFNPQRLEGLLIKNLLQKVPEQKVYESLLFMDTFLNAILRVSGQKYLENISMTSNLYS